MMATQNNLAGSAVFWTLGESTNYQSLSNALTMAGFGKFTPERMSDYSALKETLEKEFSDCQVFPVKNSANTFEVVRIKRDQMDKRNEYHHVLTASVTRWLTIETDTLDATIDVRLSERFNAIRATVPYHNVSRALVDIVYTLGGTTLRPSGGIYWIPNERWERWELVSQAIEKAGEKNRVFALRTVFDENSAQVIREALTVEIQREARAIDATLSDPTNGIKAAGTAKRKANDLRRKIECYEKSFEMTLPDLKRALDEAIGLEAKSTLLDIASTGSLLFAQ